MNPRKVPPQDRSYVEAFVRSMIDSKARGNDGRLTNDEISAVVDKVLRALPPWRWQGRAK